MPTYDYICEACEGAVEIFQSISANPVRKCPSCGELRLKRQIGAGAGFLFKGSGFYVTDYRSADYKKQAAAESKAASGAKEGDSKSAGAKSEGSKSEGAKPKPASKATASSSAAKD